MAIKSTPCTNELFVTSRRRLRTACAIASWMTLFFLMIRPPPRSTQGRTLFPYTTLFRSQLPGSARLESRWRSRDHDAGRDDPAVFLRRDSAKSRDLRHDEARVDERAVPLDDARRGTLPPGGSAAREAWCQRQPGGGAQGDRRGEDPVAHHARRRAPGSRPVGPE